MLRGMETWGTSRSRCARMGAAWGASPVGSDRPPALDHPDEDHDDRDHQENVDEAAHRVGADEAEDPQHDQDHRDRPKHGDVNLAALARDGARSMQSRK